jgi:hypothetical protein
MNALKLRSRSYKKLNKNAWIEKKMTHFNAYDSMNTLKLVESTKKK